MKPSTKGFSECVELADIIKFADQRILDTSLLINIKTNYSSKLLERKDLNIP